MALTIDVISIFPGMFSPVLSLGMTGRALAKSVIELHVTDLREHTTDKHRSTDDTPYGGGSGMVMLIEPLTRALSAIEQARGRGHRILMSPAGRPLTQPRVQELSRLEHLVFVCGRYEGVDNRLLDYIDEEISVGDFVLSGGELPAMAVIDAVARLLPGVLHNENSHEDESFQHGLLEYPQYTRPAEFDGRSVPSVLLSGNHEQIRLWRRQMSLVRTWQRRPDLFQQLDLTVEDRSLLASAEARRP
jgi:tRNA (guanine37-N1)-methyltransferase